MAPQLNYQACEHYEVKSAWGFGILILKNHIFLKKNCYLAIMLYILIKKFTIDLRIELFEHNGSPLISAIGDLTFLTALWLLIL